MAKTVKERNKELAKVGKRLRQFGMKLQANPTEEQKQKLHQNFGNARFTYNLYLSERNAQYKYNKTSLGMYEFKDFFIKNVKNSDTMDWLKKSDKFVLETALEQVDDAFDRFFKKQNKYPKFKSKHNTKQSYTTKETNKNIKVNIKDKTVQLPKVGHVNVFISKKQQEIIETSELKIKKATVTYHGSEKYIISILFEKNIDLKEKIKVEDINDEDIIAGDLGLTHFIILSDGTKIENPRYYRRQQKKLANMQRKLAKMSIGSNNYNKQKKKIAKLHLHIKNMRHDFLHKVSRKLVNENQIIILEDLNVKGMVENKKLAKSISDVGWGLFKMFVTYKADWDNKRVVLVGRFFPSSKLCNGCKEKNTFLSLNEREWVCPNCGKVHDRDDNAANNIKEEGIRILKEVA